MISASFRSISVSRSAVLSSGGTRAHARSVDAGLLCGYLGQGGSFSDAMARFGRAYANQAEADFERLVAARDAGEIPYEPGV
jgi:hypothetical protein